MRTTVFTFANQKGGVGKTTSAVTLAAGLARRGVTTLLVDTDPQGHVAFFAGLEPTNDLYKLLVPEAQAPLRTCTIGVPGVANLSVVRSSKRTTALVTILSQNGLGLAALQDALAGAPYGAVVIDTSPTVSILQTAALVASDYLIVPTLLDQASAAGIREILATLKAAQRFTACKLAGILPTQYERVTSESQAQLSHLTLSFMEKVWPPIPTDVRCREAVRQGKLLWDLKPLPRAVTGIPVEGGSLGGYQRALDRMTELLK